MRFNIMYNIGKAKYVVNHHDGKKTHDDGSPFFDMAIFSNKRKFEAFVRQLRKKGYVEGNGPSHGTERATKSIIDEVVGLLNTLVRRHIMQSSTPAAPAWFLKELKAVDFTINTMQSAIDQPEGEDVSFALAKG